MAAIFLAPSGLAEGVRVHGRANAALPMTGPQRDEQSWGALTAVMLEVPLVQQVGIGAELGAVTLSDGEPPATAGVVDPEGASGLSGALALHVRPGAERDPERRGWYSGLWGGTSVGVVRSGGLFRLMGEVSVGLDFPLGDDGFAAGPSLGLLHVFQPDDALRPADANVVSFGLHALFDTASRPPAPVPPPPPAPVRTDTDGDGISDDIDACDAEPEDKDEHEDQDGCPDADNDHDGLLDADDRCPLEAEDKDEHEDGDGCPDFDNDGDGLPEPGDKCPFEPEDNDGHADDDGCPDPDNDHDGIRDENDACPAEPEVHNGYADADGCPDAQSVRVVGDKILLDERIHFWTNSTVIRTVSHPLLRRIGELLNEHPEYVHIEVQGHADTRGDAGFNQRLSDGRAAAVKRFLIERCGVDPGRLSHAGYGSENPLVERTDPRSLYLNRRVEFSVTRATDKLMLTPPRGEVSSEPDEEPAPMPIPEEVELP